MRVPAAPVTAHDRRSPPRARIASSVPSPPSAIGQRRSSAAGQTRARPRPIAAAASGAETLPLNESGAMTTTGWPGMDEYDCGVQRDDDGNKLAAAKDRAA